MEIHKGFYFEAVLNGYLRKDNMDVFVTGSNAKLLSKDIATEFAGRGDEIPMYPLSFAEFMSIYNGDKYMGLSEYMLYGGIPLVVLREGANDKAAALQNLFNEIYLRDITKRNRVKNIGELEDLLNMLSSAIGSLTNPEKLKNTFKTIKKSRINFREFEQTHSMENVIYNELRMRGYRVDVGVIPIAERDQDGKVIRKQLEVDFVCNLGSSRYYIQSAYSLPDEAKRTQEIRPFRKIDDSFKKIVITKDIVQPYYDDYGILTVNIYDFLLDPQILQKINDVCKSIFYSSLALRCVAAFLFCSISTQSILNEFYASFGRMRLQ